MKNRLMLAISCLCVAACGSDSGSNDQSGTGGTGNGNCANIAGTWIASGQCGADQCEVTQNGCTTTFDCQGGAEAYQGTISGNNVTYAGKSAAGVDGTCSLTVSGNTMSGSCTGGGVTCTQTATRQ